MSKKFQKTVLAKNFQNNDFSPFDDEKSLSDVTISIIETSARNTADVSAPVAVAAPVAAPKMTPREITLDVIRATMRPYASIMFVNVRADYDARKQRDRVHRASIVDIIDDHVLCVVAKTIYTFTLSQLRDTMLTMPNPKSTCQQFDAAKFANDCKNNPDKNIFVPLARKSKFFSQYVPD